MPVVQDYIKYTKKMEKRIWRKTLVLMQVGSFFEVYGLREKMELFQEVILVIFHSYVICL